MVPACSTGEESENAGSPRSESAVSVVVGALRCSWIWPNCGKHIGPAVTPALTLKHQPWMWGTIGNPSDMQARQWENRLTTHLGSVSRLIAGKAGLRRLPRGAWIRLKKLNNQHKENFPLCPCYYLLVFRVSNLCLIIQFVYQDLERNLHTNE